MASPGALVRVMAEALSLPEATIVVHDRALAEAGLRTKGGRGWSAAKVTARDAAHLLTAILASDQIKDSVHSVRRYSETRADSDSPQQNPYKGLGLSELNELPQNHSFIDALVALLVSASNGSLAAQLRKSAQIVRGQRVESWPMIEVAALTPGTMGDFRIAGLGKGVSRSQRYLLPDPTRMRPDKAMKPAALKAWEAKIKSYRIETDLEQYRRVSEKTIQRLARLLAAEQEE